jgi:cell division protease FtsH
MIVGLYIFTTLLIGCANSFGIRNGFQRRVSYTMAYENVYDALKHKLVLPRKSYNTLIDTITNHDISKIYFTKQLDTVLMEKEEYAMFEYEEEQGTNIHIFPKEYSATAINPFVTDSLVDLSIKNKVEPIFLQDPTIGTGQVSFVQNVLDNTAGILGNYIVPFFFLSFVFRFFNNMRNGGGSAGMPGMPDFMTNKDITKDKLLVTKANITLDSFAGSPEIFEECTEVVSYLKNATLYEEAGAEIPRGILLEGLPGTGKTLLAKAIASEADANFISVTASEFVEMFVGMGALKVRNLFKTARENKPCILFIDEIDAVGKQRGSGFNGGNDEREQTLNQILAEMDGFADNEGILVMAATNRKDILDTALLRPGRFDRIITVPFPDKESRESILKVHSKNKFLDPSIHLGFIAELTSGFSGAQLKNLLNEAAMAAARFGRKVILESDILSSLDKLIVGIEKKVDTRSEDARRRVAIHEAGHALAAYLYNEYFELKKVTIQSTYSGAGGYTLFNEYANVTEAGLYTKDLLKKRLVVALCGKAAETIFYGEDHVSGGAIQDLKQANTMAQKMIGNYGMGDVLEVFYNENLDPASTLRGGQYSDNTKEVFDKETMYLVNIAYMEAKELLHRNKDKMNALVNALMEQKTVFGKEVPGLFSYNS